MKYFAVFLPMLSQEKSKQYRPDHLNYLKEKQEEGKIAAMGPFVDGAGGLVIYKGNSLEEVQKIVKQDPYVIHKAREVEIHEWAMVSEIL